jgi:hypothetical protein
MKIAENGERHGGVSDSFLNYQDISQPGNL